MASGLQRLHEVYPPTIQATVPLGLRVNDMVYATGLTGTDAVSGELAGDVKQQTAVALGHLKDLVERAGGSLDNIARCAGFCTRPEDRPLVDEVWMTVFPDPNDKPAFKVLTAELPAGQLVRIDGLALLGERRKRIDIPNVQAHDPTVRIGNWVFSSRCHGNDPATGQVLEGLEAQTRQTLDNLGTLIKLAGGSEANIAQITMFGHNEGYLEPARRVFEERFSDPKTRPELRQLVNVVTARFEIAIEMVAVL